MKIRRCEINDADNSILYNLFNFYLSTLGVKGVNNMAITNSVNEASVNVVTEFIISNITYIVLLVGAVLFLMFKFNKRVKVTKKIKKEDKMLYLDVMTNLKNRNYLNLNMPIWENSKIYPQTIIMIDLNNINWKKAIIDKEYGVKVEKEDKTTNRRIDLIIFYNDNNKEKSFAVIIENKTKRETGDQDSQIKDYYDKISKNYKNVYAIYLTPKGKLPSENSLPEEYYKKELYGKFANIRHAEIGYWLEGILKRQEFSFLNNEEENSKYNYKLLKSALIQIIDNEKSISGESEEGDMTKDKINKLLEKELFQNIKTIEETQEYIDMFEKVKGLLEEHRNLIVKKQISTFLNFTKEVAKKLEKQSYKKGDAPDKDTYCICDDNHVIEHGCHWLGLGELIFLQANYDNSMIYHFGVCVGKNDIKMKRKIKKL